MELNYAESIKDGGDCFDESESDEVREERTKKLRDGMKSFLSGHSSFSFYCAIFLIIYLQNRLNSSKNAQRLLNIKSTICQKTTLRVLLILRYNIHQTSFG